MSAGTSGLLNEHHFRGLCDVLKVRFQNFYDPDKKEIDKAYRRLALKTHPDKGGDPKTFRRITEAYRLLQTHVDRLEASEADSELMSSSMVIVEIAKMAIDKWAIRLRTEQNNCAPRTHNLHMPLFDGPYMQFRSRCSRAGGLVVVTLYSDPPDGLPKLHVRCSDPLLWMCEHNLQPHLHVRKREKKLRFEQWRLMSTADFGFCRINAAKSAAHEWIDEHQRRRAERAINEEEEKEAEVEAEEEKERSNNEEGERSKNEHEEPKGPWWRRYVSENSDFSIGETTPPPEDLYPTVYNDK